MSEQFISQPESEKPKTEVGDTAPTIPWNEPQPATEAELRASAQEQQEAADAARSEIDDTYDDIDDMKVNVTLRNVVRSDFPEGTLAKPASVDSMPPLPPTPAIEQAQDLKITVIDAQGPPAKKKSFWDRD